MFAIRAFFARHRQFAWLLVAMAMVIRAWVPAGYMPEAHGQRLTMRICADTSGAQILRQVVIPARHDGKTAEHGGPDGICAFAAQATPSAPPGAPLLPAPMLAVQDDRRPPAQLAVTPARDAIRQRPPLRGPPAQG